MKRCIPAIDVKVREINPLFLKHSITADYSNLDGTTGYGRITMLKRKAGVLEGKILGSEKWRRLERIYIV